MVSCAKRGGDGATRVRSMRAAFSANLIRFARRSFCNAMVSLPSLPMILELNPRVAGWGASCIASRMTDSSQDIRDRTFAFACAVARFALQLPPRPSIRCLVDQLLKSATSVGANLEEAKAGSSTREFIRCVEIALREAREATYWLRICIALRLGPAEELELLRGEGDQISRILAAIVIKTKTRAGLGCAVFEFCILNFALVS